MRVGYKGGIFALYGKAKKNSFDLILKVTLGGRSQKKRGHILSNRVRRAILPGSANPELTASAIYYPLSSFFGFAYYRNIPGRVKMRSKGEIGRYEYGL